jgi:ATP-binding protein involved in chromosome partitioning
MSNGRVAAARHVAENYVDSYLGLPLGDAKAVKSVRLDGNTVHVEVELGFPAGEHGPELKAALERDIARIPETAPLRVDVGWRVEARAASGKVPQLAGVRNVIAVASGKGGVGKSTTATNLAVGLAMDGASVGLLDADIYGPSQPRMMGLTGQRPSTRDGKKIEPLIAHGVRVMSIGFLIDEEQPMVWRGPMVTQALMQLLGDTLWGDLDYLIVDMPPGTGDIQLTLAQRVPVSGAVIVTTPQDIALADARKGLRMFEKVAVPVLGIVENMATHVCSNCGHEDPIFGQGGGAAMAEQYHVALLGQLPLDSRIRRDTDDGRPVVLTERGNPIGRAYADVARRTAARLSVSALVAAPVITVEES